MTKEEVKNFLKRIFKIRMNEEIGSLESKKINFNSENPEKINYKGISGDKSKDIAKNKVYNEMIGAINEIFKEAKKINTLKQIKNPKPKKYRIIRDPKSYKRKVYVPVRIFSDLDFHFLKGSAELFNNDMYYLSRWKEMKSLFESNGLPISITFTWKDITPDRTCRICWRLNGKNYNLNEIPMDSGRWGISHPGCDCKLIPKIYFFGRVNYFENLEDIEILLPKILNIFKGSKI